MTTTDTQSGGPGTGSLDLTDAGAALLAELAEDESPIPVKDPAMHAAGSYISAIALHVPAGLYGSLTSYAEPTVVDLEITAVSAVAAQEIAERLPWTDGRVLRDQQPAEDESLGTHRMWTGVLWGLRVRVAGLEAPEGGEPS